MNSNGTTKAKLTSLALVVLFLFGPLPSHSANLGLAVNVETQSDDSNRSSSKEIWFLGEQGSEVSRRISVRGLGDIAQNLELRYYDVEVVNGEKTYQQQELSRAQDWFRFTEESPSVEPGEVKILEIVATIPSDAREELLEGIMVVIATGKDEIEVDRSGGGAVGVVTSEAGVAIPFKLAVGDMAALQPLFSIEDVEGVLIDGENYLRTFFRNEGTVPVILSGTVQLSDAVFADRLFGPYEYRSREIPAGAMGFIDIAADPEITEGDYSAFVVAQQFGVKESRVLDVFIEYLPPGTLKFWDIAPWIGMTLVSGVLMVIGVRIFRSPSGKDGDLVSSPKPKRVKIEKVKKVKKVRPQKAVKPEVLKRPEPAQPEKIQPEPIKTERANSPTVEELVAALKLKDQAQAPTREPKVKKPKKIRERTKSSAPTYMPPPPEVDPWDFLKAGREGRWSDTEKQQNAKKKQSADQTSSK